MHKAPTTDEQKLERIGSFGYGVYRVDGQYAVADPDDNADGFYLVVPTIAIAYEEMEFLLEDAA